MSRVKTKAMNRDFGDGLSQLKDEAVKSSKWRKKSEEMAELYKSQVVDAARRLDWCKQRRICTCCRTAAGKLGTGPLQLAKQDGTKKRDVEG